jgi:hypothetical protein
MFTSDSDVDSYVIIRKLLHSILDILLRTEPLLSKDLETNNETAVAMQQRGKQASRTIQLLVETVLCNPLLGSCNSLNTTMETAVFLCGPCRGVNLKTTGAPC